ncbi:MAG: thioredoxin [Gammaproteobacteria bacterium]|nr:thioredoxin [Gammaproteobacteria bacterium]
MADSPFIFEIDDSNYEQIVLLGSRQVPVLVDFWATWCQPCQVLMPVLAQLVDEYNGRFILAKINTEEQQAIAAQFGIRSIPTVKLFKNGQPVDEFMGALPEAQIRAFLDKHLPRASDGIVAQAEQRLAAGDYPGAVELLEQAHASDPANPRIVVAMAHAQAASGDTAGAQQLLDGLPEDQQNEPDIKHLRSQLFFGDVAVSGPSPSELANRLSSDPGDSEARFGLAANQVMSGDIDGAVDNYLAIMQKDRKFGDDAARAALLRLFDMLGDDPAVNRYRARMFTLLH